LIHRKNKYSCSYNLFKKIVLNIANKKYPEIKKRTYPLEYYLNNFIYVLNDVVKWKSLRLFNPLKKEYHWKSIYNEFNKWSHDNIFKDAFNEFIKVNYFKISQIKKNKKLNMFIDVTKIYNKLLLQDLILYILMFFKDAMHL
jgi:hypothetical protein